LKKAEGRHPSAATSCNKRPREEEEDDGARKRPKPINKCSKFFHE
jgi:hypothetical protein